MYITVQGDWLGIWEAHDGCLHTGEQWGPLDAQSRKAESAEQGRSGVQLCLKLKTKDLELTGIPPGGSALEAGGQCPRPWRRLSSSEVSRHPSSFSFTLSSLQAYWQCHPHLSVPHSQIAGFPVDHLQIHPELCLLFC